MRKLKLVLLGVVLLALAFGFWVHHRGEQARVDHGAADGPLVLSGSLLERGRYLTAAADCTACHTVPDGEAYAGGVAFRLPIGTIYSSNLTADRETGIGGWSEQEFVDAVRAGIAPGGRHLYPAHPYLSYAGLARNDVLAIRAYLMSLPPVRHAVPRADLTWPFSERALIGVWQALYQPAVGYVPAAGHDLAWNQGAYLAGPLGHCGECHTKRNLGYALAPRHSLQGAVTNGWKAYNITPEGLASWSPEALDQYLAKGHAPGHGVAVGSMKEVVMMSTSQLSGADRAALVTYLLAGRRDAGVTPAEVVSVADETSTGAHLYAGACAGCHGAGAAAPAYADLRGASTVRDPAGTNLLRLLAEGSGHGDALAPPMPAFGASYSDAERAALANYVLARFGGLQPALRAKDAAASAR